MLGKIRLILIVFLTLSVIAGGVFFIFDRNREDYAVQISLPPVSEGVAVYVGGEVASPGLYRLPQGSRMADLLDAAGGLTGAGDSAAVNPAAILHDGAQIYVPAEGETSQKININTAEVWLLDALPGIGETLARRIVDFRIENGPFSSVDDLKNVEGMRQSTIENISDKVTVR